MANPQPHFLEADKHGNLSYHFFSSFGKNQHELSRLLYVTSTNEPHLPKAIHDYEYCHASNKPIPHELQCKK